jgi:hypothetical protein
MDSDSPVSHYLLHLLLLGSKRLQLDGGGGATPFPLKGLEVRGAISIPTAPTKVHDFQRLIEAFGTK